MTQSVPGIYVAGSYSQPDPVANTRRVVEVADRLLDPGFAPVVPHLCRSGIGAAAAVR